MAEDTGALDGRSEPWGGPGNSGPGGGGSAMLSGCGPEVVTHHGQEPSPAPAGSPRSQGVAVVRRIRGGGGRSSPRSPPRRRPPCSLSPSSILPAALDPGYRSQDFETIMGVMKIGVLGWGSLVRSPGRLRVDGSWRDDGPCLPIEFARVSRDGRLTLVLYVGTERARTLWALSAFDDLDVAIENLREREETDSSRIGYVTASPGNARCEVVPTLATTIREWADQKGIDTVIWTDLPSNFKEKTGKHFSEENAIAYLSCLEGAILVAARKYIMTAPRQITTRLRSRIEAELGWMP